MDKRNLTAILVPVAICIIVFLLPVNIQDIFVLKMDNLNLWSWFTHIFVHANFKHLALNMLWYILAMFLAYSYLPKKDKARFYLPILIIIILTPILTFISNLFILKIYGILFLNQKGFSAVSASALGFLGFSLAKRAIVLCNQEKNKNFLISAYSFVLIFTLGAMVYNISLKAMIITTLISVLILISLVFMIKYNLTTLSLQKWNKKEVIIIFLGFLILFLGVLNLVPQKIVTDSTIIDILAHYVGFVTGFITILLTDWLFSSSLLNQKNHHIQ